MQTPTFNLPDISFSILPGMLGVLARHCSISMREGKCERRVGTHIAEFASLQDRKTGYPGTNDMDVDLDQTNVHLRGTGQQLDWHKFASSIGKTR